VCSKTGNRNIDSDNRVLDRPIYPIDNPEDIWRSVDIPRMLTKVIVSPFAEPSTNADAEREIAAGGYELPVELSEMTAHATLVSLTTSIPSTIERAATVTSAASVRSNSKRSQAAATRFPPNPGNSNRS
jgi:hypothetical protein